MSIFIQVDQKLVNVDAIWYVSKDFPYCSGEIHFDGANRLTFHEPFLTVVRKILDATSSKEKENIPPTPPIREKENERENTTPRARTRVKFEKPTLKEVADHVAEKGYTFDAEEFWNFYESKGWRVGSHVMKSWVSACVTWQKKREREERNEAARTAHLDQKMDEIAEKRTAHIDAKMDEREKNREKRAGTIRRHSSNYVQATPEEVAQFAKQMEGEQ